MAQFLAPIINEQQLDANGAPLSGGTISVYVAGSSTPSTTYSDKAGLVPNTWPIVLNTLGVSNQGEVWITGGASYKFVIKDSTGVVQRTLDNITGINDNTVVADQWIVYQGTPTYVSPTSFTVPGDQTQTFIPGTRVKTTNTGGIVYGTVVRSVFSTSTTVTIIPDSGSLDSGLSVVSTGLITGTNTSFPGTLTTPPFRNRLLNGAFRIDQRGQGTSRTIVAAAAIAYTVDRFYAACAGANVTLQPVAGTGYQSAVTITGAASVTSTLFGQRIEAANCFDWVGKQVNVQIPVSATGISSLIWNAYTADTTNNFSSKTLIATGTVAISSTIETKYFSFNAGANAGRGVAIELITSTLTAGQSITYQGAFQAEAGQVSPFETVEIGEDLRRCKRYLPAWLSSSTNDPVGAGQCVTTTVAFVSFPFDVEARAPITSATATGSFAVSDASGAAITLTALTAASAGKRSAVLSCPVTAGLVAGSATNLRGTLATSAIFFNGAEL